MSVLNDNVWKSVLEIKTNCFGVIIFSINDSENSENDDKCVIVKTHPSSTGGVNVGFPKGKSKKYENIFMCASRELEEETGIKFSQLDFVEGVSLSEMSNKGNPSVTYLIAKYKNNENNHVFTYDKNELSFSGFLTFDESIKSMWKDRVNLMYEAYEIVKKTNNFTDGSLLENFGKQIQDNKMQHDKSYKISKTNRPNQNENRNENRNEKNWISKFMSYVLRHGANKLNIKMDDSAYVKLDELLKLDELHNMSIENIKEIVNTNEKKRFELMEKNGILMIRASQGHSKEMKDTIDETKLLNEIIVPLKKCIHGTDYESWKIIKKTGLKPMNRMHIHCAISEPNDVKVTSGVRSSSKVLIYLNMKLAIEDGMKFYMSTNEVILTNGINGEVHPRYFEKIVFM